MRFLTDECCDAPLVDALRGDGHYVLLRFGSTDRALKIPRLRDLLAQDADRLPGAFIVLEVEKVRIRPLI